MDRKGRFQRWEKPVLDSSTFGPPFKRPFPDNRTISKSNRFITSSSTSSISVSRTNHLRNPENTASNPSQHFSSTSAHEAPTAPPPEEASEPLGLPFMTYRISKEEKPFEEFLSRWRSAPRYAFCLVYIPQNGINTSTSTSRSTSRDDARQTTEEIDPRCYFDAARLSIPEEDVIFLPEAQKPIGLVVAWDNARCYFVSLVKSSKGLEDHRWRQNRLDKIKEILEMPDTEKVLFDSKPHLKIFMNWNIFIRYGVRDPRIAAWVLEPDEYKDVSLRELIKKSADGGLALPIEKLQSTGNSAKDGIKQAIRSSLLLAHQSLIAMSYLEGELKLSSQYELFIDIEMKLLPILAKMEFYGVGFSRDTLLKARGHLETKIKNLEERATKLAKKTFDLNSPSEVSYILFEHLKLPYPSLDGGATKGFASGILPAERGKETSQSASSSSKPSPAPGTSRNDLAAAPTRMKRVEKSTKAEVLQAMASGPNPHPLPQIVLEHRTLSHTINNYMDPLPHFAFESKRLGMTRIYSSCHQTVVPTGRLAYDHPNLQSIRHSFEFIPVKRSSRRSTDENEGSRESETFSSGEVDDSSAKLPIRGSSDESGGSPNTPLGTPIEINIRDAFVAQEGMTLVSFDYCQLELRIMAHFANEEKLLTQLSDPNVDMFNVVAGHWLCKSPLAVTADERVQAKHICYGILYGMGIQTLSRILKVSTSQARDFKKAFQDRFHGLTAFLTNVVIQTRNDGYSKTLGNRRRNFPDVYKNEKSKDRTEREDYARAVRQITNTVCQGSAADIVKMATIQIEEMLLKVSPQSRCIINLHDELVYEIPSLLLDQIVPAIKNIMETVMPLRLPLPVRIFYGPTWGHLSPYILPE